MNRVGTNRRPRRGPHPPAARSATHSLPVDWTPKQEDGRRSTRTVQMQTRRAWQAKGLSGLA